MISDALRYTSNSTCLNLIEKLFEILYNKINQKRKEIGPVEFECHCEGGKGREVFVGHN